LASFFCDFTWGLTNWGAIRRTVFTRDRLQRELAAQAPYREGRKPVRGLDIGRSDIEQSFPLPPAQ
jgi:hypothetical protein